MIEKVFTNEQAMAHLDYALTCGFGFEKFISGKGMYGNRVSLVRPKDVNRLYTSESGFKNSDFHSIEGIKALEITQTILLTRQKLESVFSKHNMSEFLSNFASSFISNDDMQRTLDNWDENVSQKLLGNRLTDFKRLNNFVLAHIVLDLPMPVQECVASFRQQQILGLLTQDIISADFAKSRLDLLPSSQDKLLSLRQKLLLQRNKAAA
jgi:hypothetical protein